MLRAMSTSAPVPVPHEGKLKPDNHTNSHLKIQSSSFGHPLYKYLAQVSSTTSLFTHITLIATLNPRITAHHPNHHPQTTHHYASSQSNIKPPPTTTMCLFAVLRHCCGHTTTKLVQCTAPSPPLCTRREEALYTTQFLCHECWQEHWYVPLIPSLRPLTTRAPHPIVVAPSTHALPRRENANPKNTNPPPPPHRDTEGGALTLSSARHELALAELTGIQWVKDTTALDARAQMARHHHGERDSEEEEEEEEEEQMWRRRVEEARAQRAELLAEGDTEPWESWRAEGYRVLEEGVGEDGMDDGDGIDRDGMDVDMKEMSLSEEEGEKSDEGSLLYEADYEMSDCPMEESVSPSECSSSGVEDEKMSDGPVVESRPPNYSETDPEQALEGGSEEETQEEIVVATVEPSMSPRFSETDSELTSLDDDSEEEEDEMTGAAVGERMSSILSETDSEHTSKADSGSEMAEHGEEELQSFEECPGQSAEADFETMMNEIVYGALEEVVEEVSEQSPEEDGMEGIEASPLDSRSEDCLRDILNARLFDWIANERLRTAFY